MLVTAEEKSIQLTEPSEHSEPSQKVSNAPLRPDSVGVTQSARTLRATVWLEPQIVYEADTETPTTISDLANEQREFLRSLPDSFVDIDFGTDN